MQTLDFICKKYGVGKKGRIEIPDMDRRDLAILFNDLGFKRGVEIGVERAIYSKSLCMRIKDLHLTCVDPWQAYKGYREHVSQEKLDGFYEESKKRLAPYNVDFIRDYSVNAAKQFQEGELDFVYIDGNHEFSHTVADIAAWTPKVRIGGIVAGHDYIARKNPEYLMGVIPAIHGYTEAYQIEPLFIAGAKDKKEGWKRDDQRSWFFVVEKNPNSYKQP